METRCEVGNFANTQHTHTFLLQFVQSIIHAANAANGSMPCIVHSSTRLPVGTSAEPRSPSVSDLAAARKVILIRPHVSNQRRSPQDVQGGVRMALRPTASVRTRSRSSRSPNCHPPTPASSLAAPPSRAPSVHGHGAQLVPGGWWLISDHRWWLVTDRRWWLVTDG